MDNNNLSITFLVDKTPGQVFDAINNIKAWWTENLTGNTENSGDEFAVHFGDIHYSRHKLTEVIFGKKVVWLVTDSKLTFVDKQDEWTGTQNVFEITEQDGKTQLQFTHVGLVPQFQCYNGCSSGWNYYIGSLQNFIATGKGSPDLKTE